MQILESESKELNLDDAIIREQRAFEDSNPKSRAKFEAARDVLPGGNTRLSLYFDPFPLFFQSAQDSKVTDADGHEYADFSNDLTAALYGHSNKEIISALRAALENGMSFGGTHDHEVEYAREICRRFPSIDRVRFLTSGTEANVAAIQLARAETGRRLVLGFHGGYHGNIVNWYAPSNEMNVDRGDVLLARFNHIESVRKLVTENGNDIAAILVEPIMGSAGGFTAETEFLAELRSICDEIGALLIYDEVQTARFAVGGYQSVVGISPDLTTLGKFFGGGLNFGALGGRASHMDRLGPGHERMLMHGGTFNNNVLTMIAGFTALKKIMTAEAIERLNVRADRLRSDLTACARDRAIPLQLSSFGSLIATHFQRDMPKGPEDVKTPPGFRKLFQLYLINRGIFITRRGQFTLSFANSDSEYELLERLFGRFLDDYGHLVYEFDQDR